MELTNEQLEIIVRKVAERLAAGSQGVGEIPLVETLNGINSLPCNRVVNGVEEVVEVPLPVLAAPSLDAAEIANVAAKNANEKADKAQQTEDLCKEGELARGVAEQSRVDAESNRKTDETVRGDNEETRLTNESSRVLSESARVEAENIRIAAESSRKEEYGGIINALNIAGEASANQTVLAKTATDNANKATEASHLQTELCKTATDNANTAAGSVDDSKEAALQAAAEAVAAKDAALNAKEASESQTALALKATTDANSAADNANDTAAHPTYIGADNYVYQWNKAAKSYDKTGIFVKGDAFTVRKTYPSVEAMNADADNSDIIEGSFVLINTDDVENPDNARLYVKVKNSDGTYSYAFMVDMSGAVGFTGKTPQFSIGTVSKDVDPVASLSEDGVDGNGNPKFKLNLVLPKGDPFIYDDFTPEQLDTLKMKTILLLPQACFDVNTEDYSAVLEAFGGMDAFKDIVKKVANGSLLLYRNINGRIIPLYSKATFDDSKKTYELDCNSISFWDIYTNSNEGWSLNDNYFQGWNGPLYWGFFSDEYIVDALTSTDSSKVLSACQGKILNDKIASSANVMLLPQACFDVYVEDYSDVIAGFGGLEAFKNIVRKVANGSLILYRNYNGKRIPLYSSATFDDSKEKYTLDCIIIDLGEYYYNSTTSWSLENNTFQGWDGPYTTGFFNFDCVADSLTSTDSSKVLSARQGKILNDKIASSANVMLLPEICFSLENEAVLSAFGGADAFKDIVRKVANGGLLLCRKVGGSITPLYSSATFNDSQKTYRLECNTIGIWNLYNNSNEGWSLENNFFQTWNGPCYWGFLSDDCVVDTLTSTDSSKILSAHQGKILNDRLNSVELFSKPPKWIPSTYETINIDSNNPFIFISSVDPMQYNYNFVVPNNVNFFRIITETITGDGSNAAITFKVNGVSVFNTSGCIPSNNYTTLYSLTFMKVTIPDDYGGGNQWIGYLG